ncbi:hypothetical protein Taro_007862 [Colocasia esculenta]|uniref:Uncharacterized protein n=1 Tax=Colocasia esculenta TaxID=4460 RepID=A0A843U1K3_COLES|nr:hypothetical protein [Colocasia esculenta]
MSHHRHGHLRPPQGRGPTSRTTLDLGHYKRSRNYTLQCHHGRHQGKVYKTSGRGSQEMETTSERDKPSSAKHRAKENRNQRSRAQSGSSAQHTCRDYGTTK